MAGRQIILHLPTVSFLLSFAEVPALDNVRGRGLDKEVIIIVIFITVVFKIYIHILEVSLTSEVISSCIVSKSLLCTNGVTAATYGLTQFVMTVGCKNIQCRPPWKRHKLEYLCSICKRLYGTIANTQSTVKIGKLILYVSSKMSNGNVNSPKYQEIYMCRFPDCPQKTAEEFVGHVWIHVWRHSSWGCTTTTMCYHSCAWQ